MDPERVACSRCGINNSLDVPVCQVEKSFSNLKTNEMKSRASRLLFDFLVLEVTVYAPRANEQIKVTWTK
jgi:hypothetical protein